MVARRIFVSHHHSDNSWCREFVEELKFAGFDIWYDEKLLGGDQWIRSIEQEIQDREIFLIVLSPKAWTSAWVKKELDIALIEHKQIIPVIHKPVRLTGFITSHQFIDASGKNGVNAAHQVAGVLRSGNMVSPFPPTESTSSRQEVFVQDGLSLASLISVILRAQFRVYMLDIWIGDDFEDFGAAFANTPAREIKIIMLSESSPVAKLRSSSLNRRILPVSVEDRILANKKVLSDWQAKMPYLKARQHHSFTSNHIVIIDDYVLLGFYFQGIESRKGPFIEFPLKDLQSRYTTLGFYIEREFNALWEESLSIS